MKEKLKRALITGFTGQDGSYLAKLLIKKGYAVHALSRYNSQVFTTNFNTKNSQESNSSTVKVHYGDLTDGLGIMQLMKHIKPDEVYNLGAQSHVGLSFQNPEHFAQTNGLGTLRILEAIKTLGLKSDTKFYQASSSELYGNTSTQEQNEETPFAPCSPYAISKLFAYWTTVNYREAYGIFACNGILFNHESPVRGEGFVTRKVTKALSRIKVGLQETLQIGNLEARRDWGHAEDFVRAQWLMLQAREAKDYCIATGRNFSVRELIEVACKELGLQIEWRGEGLNEIGVNKESNKTIISVDASQLRPTDVNTLLGDYTKAKVELGWEPKISFESLIAEMVKSDLQTAQAELKAKKEKSPS